MIGLLRCILLLGSLATAGLSLQSCLRQAEAEDGPAAAEIPDLEARESLLPGTAQFWPSQLGDNADSLYCDARLKLPLSSEPVWTQSYSEARFSRHFPDALLHRDGLLYVSARGSQIMGLSASDGEIVFNLDLYKHLPAEQMGRNNVEEFESLQLHPRNLLFARDNLGRHYCWDMQGGEPRSIWVGRQTHELGQGMLAADEQLTASWRGSLNGIDPESGKREWQYPTLNEGYPSSGAAVLAAADGKLVMLPLYQGAFVVDKDGSLLWKVDGKDYVSSASIDDARGNVYLIYDEGERLECRSLIDGSLNWRYDYSQLLPEAERSEMFRQAREIRPNFDLVQSIRPQASLPVVFPDGICFATLSGEIVMLNADGSLRWQLDQDCISFCWGGYRNAVMFRQIYLNPKDTSRFLDFVPFSLKKPDWAAAQPEKTSELRTPFANANRRYLVLDPQTGAELDSWDFDLLHRTTAVPAGDKIVFGYEPGEEGLTGGIAAYNWLEAEDSN